MTTKPPPDAARAGPRRWLAHPVLSAFIAASWLLLQGSLAPANLLWAAIFGLVLPWALHPFIAGGPTPRAPAAMLRLALVVLRDIVVANMVVARIVLDPRRQPNPRWVAVRYDLEDPRAIALLATIITNTPGTVSCRIDERQRVIHVHALDAGDAQAVEAEIKARYEQPLKEILG